MDRSEEQIAKDKEAVLRMVGAKSAMEAAHRRIELLETTLDKALRQADDALGYISDKAYRYRSEISIRSEYKDAFARLRSAL